MIMTSFETRVAEGNECGEAAVYAFEHEAFLESGEDCYHQTANDIHLVINNLSIWFIAATYGGVILLRQDDLALWAVIGAVLNVLLSFVLKRILNQERPYSDVCSGPGMPSTHAQSISFAAVFIILSITGWLEVNGISVILSGLVIAVGVYLSWLRVLLRYHTTCQVVAGTVVGSIFSLLWFCTCDETLLKSALVRKAAFNHCMVANYVQIWIQYR
ncbi:lipid phosphate phosphatase epsilon 2, chloroplastic-like [Rutidosis leptorrhynchoides]|uniref:lipid phosphate phosphatase epsilon 2, chloroplastic-like n=1 Tax=Rutidosis leptorrhynchoides TaxID=125765 RepID=UPI003A991C6F